MGGIGRQGHGKDVLREGRDGMDEKEVMKREGWNGWEDGMECNGKGKKGKQRDRMGWDGKGWDRMGRDGMGQDGTGWGRMGKDGIG